jgi:hypothetical protein
VAVAVLLFPLAEIISLPLGGEFENAVAIALAEVAGVPSADAKVKRLILESMK